MSEILFRQEKTINDEKGDVLVMKPNPLSLKNKTEKLTLKAMLVRLYFWFISFGSFYVYYVKNNEGKVVHTSYVLSKCLKFNFLKKDECIIGPCWTHESERGRGIYPKVLKYIVGHHDKSVFYIVASDDNIPSVKGIEKAFFKRCGFVQISKILKIYRMEKE